MLTVPCLRVLQSEDPSNRSICYGVTKGPLSDPSYTSSPSLVVLRSYTGVVHRFGAEGEAVTQPFGTPGDLITMTFKADTGTLSFNLNDTTVRASCRGRGQYKGLMRVCVCVQVIAARDLPPGEYFPVITFYNEYMKALDWIDLTGALAFLSAC